jgi:hypothetical protein
MYRLRAADVVPARLGIAASLSVALHAVGMMAAWNPSPLTRAVGSPMGQQRQAVVWVHLPDEARGSTRVAPAAAAQTATRPVRPAVPVRPAATPSEIPPAPIPETVASASVPDGADTTQESKAEANEAMAGLPLSPISGLPVLVSQGRTRAGFGFFAPSLREDPTRSAVAAAERQSREVRGLVALSVLVEHLQQAAAHGPDLHCRALNPIACEPSAAREHHLIARLLSGKHDALMSFSMLALTRQGGRWRIEPLHSARAPDG